MAQKFQSDIIAHYLILNQITDFNSLFITDSWQYRIHYQPDHIGFKDPHCI